MAMQTCAAPLRDVADERNSVRRKRIPGFEMDSFATWMDVGLRGVVGWCGLEWEERGNHFTALHWLVIDEAGKMALVRLTGRLLALGLFACVVL